jgi:hypothetical protein
VRVSAVALLVPLALLAPLSCSGRSGSNQATGGNAGTGGGVLDSGDAELEPYPSTECPHLTVYRVPEGTCLLARGSFVMRAGNDCQVSEVSTCSAWSNDGQCANRTNPLPWLCSDGFVYANLRATDGGTLTVERHEGTDCVRMCPPE